MKNTEEKPTDMREFVMGDLHGNLYGLLECLEKVKFNYEKDRLIQLGDVVDRFPHSKEVVDELLKIKNLISIKGNHDDWFLHWLNTGTHPTNFKGSGAEATLESYSRGINGNLTPDKVPANHIMFFKNQLPYLYLNGKVFVHGGYNRHFDLFNQPTEDIFWWDRDLWGAALSRELMSPLIKHTSTFNLGKNIKEVYIGHTPTINYREIKPMYASGIWNLDTGGGYLEGRVSIMNLITREVVQSQKNSILYKNEYGTY